MQVAPQNSTQVSQSLLVELFSRFFTRLLEKEDKFSIFLEEWNSFKGLLTQNPFDLDGIFIHLATIQLNLEKAVALTPSKSQLQEQPKETSYLTPKVEKGSPKNRSPKSRKDRHNSVTVKKTANSPYLDTSFGQSEELKQKRLSNLDIVLNGTGNLLEIPSTIAANSSRNFDSRPISTMELLGTSVNNISESYQAPHSRNASNVYTHAIDVPILTEINKTKYDVIFLASKARRMKETVQVHSDILLGSFSTGKKALTMQMEERTPLRRLKMYTKQDSEHGGVNAQQPQPEQYFMPEAKPLPYNQVLLHYA